MKLLTIAIPTYARNEILRKNLECLLPQLSPTCDLVILDNCSPQPVRESLSDLLEKWPDVSAKIIRHLFNIGGVGNILRTFECCQTEWIWILGDDDRVEPQAVETILRVLAEHPNADAFSFSFNMFPRSDNSSAVGIEEFVKSFDNISPLAFVSTSIYRHASFAKNIRIGYIYASSLCPHLAILLWILRGGGVIHFRKETIVDWKPAAEEERWPGFFWSITLPSLLEMPLGLTDEGFQKFQMSMSGCVLSLRHFASVLLRSGEEGQSLWARRLFHQYATRKPQAPRFTLSSQWWKDLTVRCAMRLRKILPKFILNMTIRHRGDELPKDWFSRL